jgi:hypothetical protein
MAKTVRSDLRILAATVRARLEDKDFPMTAGFKPHAKAFIAEQTTFDAAAAAVDAAEEAKHDALALVGSADDELDTSVDGYADALSQHALGPRLNPFKPFSKYPPSKVKDLAYAIEVEVVRAIVAAVDKQKPPAAVIKAGKACLAHAAAVEKALAAYGKPATAYQKALAQRDARMPEMQKALKTLKKHAASAYADDEATVTSLFAPPEAVQAPKKRRPKSAKKAAAKSAKKTTAGSLPNGAPA